MEKKLYEIKPLEWEGKDPETSLMSNVPFGYYSINKKKAEYASGSYTVYYSFDDEYDYGKFDVDSIEDGKKKAFEHWCERLSKGLTPVDPDRWIPVEERLPEIPCKVLVKDHTGNIAIGRYDMHANKPTWRLEGFLNDPVLWKPIKD